MKTKNLSQNLIAMALWVLSLGVAHSAEADEAQEVKFLTDHNLKMETYLPFQLLKAALARVDTDYDVSVVFTRDLDIADGQHVTLLKANSDVFDVVFAGALPTYETSLRTVYFPIHRGILSWRVMAIRAEDQEKFRQIETLEDFQKFLALQGTGWTDVTILREAGFEVLTGEYRYLYDMLAAGNGDFFSRGVLEISEIETYNNPEIVLDEALYLYYPLATFFYVAPKNEQLANDIQAGLEAMAEDGSYEVLLKKMIEGKDLPQKIHLAKRKGFKIENNNVTPEMIEAAQKWFYSVEEVAELVE